MAIYTNYGRFLKAKMFKDLLCGDNEYETYMLLGLGNPKWDNIGGTDNNQPMPVAPFDTNHLNPEDSELPPAENQFFDENMSMWFISPGGSSEQYVMEGRATSGKYTERCADLVPPFPGIWDNYSDSTTTEIFHSPALTQSDHHKAYIKFEDGGYKLYVYGEPGSPFTISVPSDEEEAQYFAELYLRGLALNNNLITPCGLLGAIRCKVDFVVDQGQTYNGDIEEFWYGDRYWRVVTVDENLNDNSNVFPHHLLFTATVNPRNLCADLSIDQYIVPRQLALYARKRKVTGSTGSGSDAKLQYATGERFYRVGENVFNFGQYATTPSGAPGEVLNFTLPFKPTGGGDTNTRPDGEFKFLLNDYIKGSARDPHSVDRLGYIVGF